MLTWKPTVKINVSVTAILLVIVLTLLATTYRVATAPERIRLRIDAAKASCVNAGGEWIKVGREEACRPAVERKNV